MISPAVSSECMERGVWIAPWKGANDETILVAVRRDGRMLAERVLGFGDDHVKAGEELWEMLEREDPAPTLRLVV